MSSPRGHKLKARLIERSGRRCNRAIGLIGLNQGRLTPGIAQVVISPFSITKRISAFSHWMSRADSEDPCSCRGTRIDKRQVRLSETTAEPKTDADCGTEHDLVSANTRDKAEAAQTRLAKSVATEAKKHRQLCGSVRRIKAFAITPEAIVNSRRRWGWDGVLVSLRR